LFRRMPIHSPFAFARALPNQAINLRAYCAGLPTAAGLLPTLGARKRTAVQVRGNPRLQSSTGYPGTASLNQCPTTAVLPRLASERTFCSVSYVARGSGVCLPFPRPAAANELTGSLLIRPRWLSRRGRAVRSTAVPSVNAPPNPTVNLTRYGRRRKPGRAGFQPVCPSGLAPPAYAGRLPSR
jgi:hypothetical protein